MSPVLHGSMCVVGYSFDGLPAWGFLSAFCPIKGGGGKWDCMDYWFGGGFELCTEAMSAVYTVPKPEVNCFVDIWNRNLSFNWSTISAERVSSNISCIFRRHGSSSNCKYVFVCKACGKLGESGGMLPQDFGPFIRCKLVESGTERNPAYGMICFRILHMIKNWSWVKPKKKPTTHR